MGGDNSILANAKPAHKVYLDTFYIGKYPVTNAEYRRYCEDIQQQLDLPSGKEAHPVTGVSWYDARNYAAWAGTRLLTEAEWEKAASWEQESNINQQGSLSCSEQLSGKKRIYPWGDQFDTKKCNTVESGIGTTTPVDRYSPQGDSPYGCADMGGNVWEWTHSLYVNYPYVPDDGREEMKMISFVDLVQRGGSFRLDASYTRCTFRFRIVPDLHFDDYGFRVGFGIPSALDNEGSEP